MRGKTSVKGVVVGKYVFCLENYLLNQCVKKILRGTVKLLCGLVDSSLGARAFFLKRYRFFSEWIYGL